MTEITEGRLVFVLPLNLKTEFVVVMIIMTNFSWPPQVRTRCHAVTIDVTLRCSREKHLIRTLGAACNSFFAIWDAR